jgi:hypothetical protein
LTLGIAALAGVIYVLSRQRQRLASFLGGSRLEQAIKLYRLALGAGAVVAVVLSLFPRASTGMGVILYFFLWPLVATQFGLSFLPWQRLAQKGPLVIITVAGVVGYFAYYIDRMLLQLAGYVT